MNPVRSRDRLRDNQNKLMNSRCDTLNKLAD